jgi:hypothetical protein
MEPARKISEDTSVLPSYFPIPGLGLLPVNAFVVKAQQPVLLDTGLHMDTDASRGSSRQSSTPPT